MECSWTPRYDLTFHPFRFPSNCYLKRWCCSFSLKYRRISTCQPSITVSTNPKLTLMVLGLFSTALKSPVLSTCSPAIRSPREEWIISKRIRGLAVFIESCLFKWQKVRANIWYITDKAMITPLQKRFNYVVLILGICDAINQCSIFWRQEDNPIFKEWLFIYLHEKRNQIV